MIPNHVNGSRKQVKSLMKYNSGIKDQTFIFVVVNFSVSVNLIT